MIFCKEDFKPQDPTGRVFNTRVLDPVVGANIMACFSILLAWSSIAHWSPMATMNAYRVLMYECAPRRRSSRNLAAYDPHTLPNSHGIPANQLKGESESWWTARKNEAFLCGLHLNGDKLEGVVINSVTSKTLALNNKNFATISEVSGDGTHFPKDRKGFESELLSQAAELHNSRKDFEMDIPTLTTGASLYKTTQTDYPDFANQMELLRQSTESQSPSGPAGAPLTLRELLSQRSRSSSEATSLDEMPNSLVKHIDGHGMHALCRILADLHTGEECSWLTTLIHLCLRKKKPEWLVANSRPVLLGPYLRRLESGVVYNRYMGSAERLGAIPPSHYAYRKGMSPQHCAMFSRWAIAHWIKEHGNLYLIDWDESNAFCNVQRKGLDSLEPDRPQLWIEDWAESFFGKVQVSVVSPWGLVGPYPLGHGGAQGDSMGVGCFCANSTGRTNYHMGLIGSGRDPVCMDNMVMGAHEGIIPSAPWCPKTPLPEVVFSDDRTLFGATEDGLLYILHCNCKSCWAVGGSENCLKLKAYRLSMDESGIIYMQGTLSSMLGEFEYENEGLVMTGVPLVMGECPSDKIQKAMTRLKILAGRVRRLQPSYILCLRVISAYVLSILDFVFESVPITEEWAESIRIAIKRVVTNSLRIPINVPNRLLYGCKGSLGFRVPALLLRFRLRFIKGIYSCVNSRSLYTREMSRLVISSPLSRLVKNHDWIVAKAWMQQYDLSLHLPQDPPLHASEVVWCLDRAPDTDVVIVTDGSKEDRKHGWGVVIADSSGIVATAHSGAMLAGGSSWTAEWLGKGLALWAIRKLQDLYPNTICRVYAADNVAAAYGSNGGRPSRCHWIDNIRLHYAQMLLFTGSGELYIPAQHDSGKTDQVATWQKEADRLAKKGASIALPRTLPLADLLPPACFLLHTDHVVCDPGKVLDTIYASECNKPCPTPPKSNPESWDRCILAGYITNGGMQLAFWHRTAPFCHKEDLDVFNCHLCRNPCSGWGFHMMWECPTAVCAVAWGMAKVAETLLDKKWNITWSDCRHFTATRSGKQFTLKAVHEMQNPTLIPSEPTDILISWSGVLYHGLDTKVAPECLDLITSTFLNSSGRWLTRDPEARLAAFLEEYTPGGWPEDIPWGPLVIATSLGHLGCPHFHRTGGKWSSMAPSWGPRNMDLGLQQFDTWAGPEPPPDGWVGVWLCYTVDCHPDDREGWQVTHLTDHHLLLCTEGLYMRMPALVKAVHMLTRSEWDSPDEDPPEEYVNEEPPPVDYMSSDDDEFDLEDI